MLLSVQLPRLTAGTASRRHIRTVALSYLIGGSSLLDHRSPPPPPRRRSFVRPLRCHRCRSWRACGHQAKNNSNSPVSDEAEHDRGRTVRCILCASNPPQLCSALRQLLLLPLQAITTPRPALQVPGHIMPTLRNGKTTVNGDRRNGQTSKHEPGKERLVLLGSGWAAYSVMQKVDRSRYAVTMSKASRACPVCGQRKRLTSLLYAQSARPSTSSLHRSSLEQLWVQTTSTV